MGSYFVILFGAVDKSMVKHRAFLRLFDNQKVSKERISRLCSSTSMFSTQGGLTALFKGATMGTFKFIAPSPADSVIHARCVLRTFFLRIEGGREIVVRVVRAATEEEANRCWSTPQRPEGTPEAEPQWYPAEIMVAEITATQKIWIKGSPWVSLFPGFADLFEEGVWKESYHTFPDRKVAHWLERFGGNLSHWVGLKQGQKGFLERHAQKIQRKQPRDGGPPPE